MENALSKSLGMQNFSVLPGSQDKVRNMSHYIAFIIQLGKD
jgi:hypothetical protein